MNKSIKKRFKITGSGKITRRKMAQDHFRAKKTGKQIRDKRGSLTLNSSDATALRRAYNLTK